jgi:hypothetical protein
LRKIATSELYLDFKIVAGTKVTRLGSAPAARRESSTAPSCSCMAQQKRYMDEAHALLPHQRVSALNCGGVANSCPRNTAYRLCWGGHHKKSSEGYFPNTRLRVICTARRALSRKAFLRIEQVHIWCLTKKAKIRAP